MEPPLPYPANGPDLGNPRFKRHRFARLDLDGLALGIQDEASGGAHLGDHHALSRLQSGDADLPGLIGAVDAVGVANQGSDAIHYR